MVTRIDQHRERIASLITSGSTHSDVLAWLAQQGILCSPRTLQRRLQAWSTSTPRLDASPELLDRIRHYFSMVLSDQATVDALEREGFSVSLKTYRRLRKELGLYKRTPQGTEAEADSQVRERLQAEYDAGNIEDFGTSHLYTYMRMKHNIVSKYAQSQCDRTAHSRHIDNTIGTACDGLHRN